MALVIDTEHVYRHEKHRKFKMAENQDFKHMYNEFAYLIFILSLSLKRTTERYTMLQHLGGIA